MKVTLEEMAQPYLIRIIEQDKDTIAAKLGEVWRSKKDSIMLDGFRKGKVPQNLAEKTLGFENLYRPYIDELITLAISNVNQDNNVTVMDLQQIIPEQLNKDGIVMQAVAYLKPVVEELDYTNVPATKLDSEATEAEVVAELTNLQEQHALMVPITDRGVQFGDIVVLSYTGYQDGTPFPGGAASNQQFLLTEDSFIPGFGDQIVGMTPSEQKTISVTFPEKYHAEHLAGKEVTFDITLHEIKFKDLPELDDEFAITCGKTTLEELKQSTNEEISKRKKAFNQSKTETEICMELVNRAKVSPIPQTMIQKRLGTLLQQEANNVGLSPEDYLKQRKMDQNVFERSYYQIAIRDLKVQLILDHIAAQEKLEASEGELEEYITTEADRLGYTVDQIRKIATEEQLGAQVKLRKAYDFLLETATYTEPPTSNEG